MNILRNFGKFVANDFKRRVVHNNKGLVATSTALIIGATVAAAGAVAATTIATSSARKASKSAQDFATQQAAEAKQEQQRLEEKFGLSAGELERQDKTFELEETQQAEAERRAGLSGEDLLAEAGPSTRALLDSVAERQGKTSEQLFIEEGGEPARQFLESVTSGDTDIFENELTLALQGVQKTLGRRGLSATGIPGDIGLESLGRAGVDVAIKSARERLEQQRVLSNTLINLSAGQRREAGQLGERALSEQEVARNNLNTFLQNLQQLDQQSQGRAAGVATQAFGTAQSAVNQAVTSQTDIAGFQAGQAAQTAKGITEGLAGLGGDLIAPTIKKAGEGIAAKAGEIFGKSRVEEDPLERLLAFTGGLQKNDPRRFSI